MSALRPFRGQLIIPQTFEDCLTYGQKQDFMWKKIQELQETVEDLEARVEALENPEEV